MDRLFAATREARYSDLARLARASFDGRNTAGIPVYDRLTGRVADGIEDGRVNRRSGAEANIVAAWALLPEVERSIRTRERPSTTAIPQPVH